MQALRLRLIQEENVRLQLQQDNPLELNIAEQIVAAQYPVYDGAYEVDSFTADPLLRTSLVLGTNGKLMADNMTIYSVPTTEEHNAQGGVTLTIGGGS